MRWLPPVVGLLALSALASVGCKKGGEACASLDAERAPERALAVCRGEAERAGAQGDAVRQARAAVAVVNALTALKDDAGVIAWAARVGDLPGAAKVWRRAAQAHERREEPQAMKAALRRSAALWEQAAQPGEGAYDLHLLRQQLFAEGQLLPALELARRERQLALTSDDAVMRWASFQGLFALLDEIGDYAGAKALLREQQARTDPKDTPSMRSLRFCEGLMFFREGRLELAKLAYRDALAMVDPETPAEELRPDYYNLVEIEVLLGDLAAAEQHLAAAVASLTAEADVNARSARAFFTALVALAKGEPGAAEAALAPALAPAPAPAPAAFWAWQLEELFGKVLEAQGKGEQALAAYRRSIVVIEAMRRELAVDALQVALRERKRAPYEAAFELLARRGEVAAAMQVARAMWQRGFVESFDVPAGEGDGSSDAAAARLRGLSSLAPQLAGEAPGQAPGRSADVLAFVEARGALWRYQRRGGEPTLERLALAAAEARQLVSALRANPDDAATAGRLAEALLPAPRRPLSGERTLPLAVIADASLAGLPFAALRRGGRFLVEERTLVYWPSLEHVGRADPAAAAAPGPVAVLAPSSGLAAARQEALELSAGLGATPRLGDAATIAALKDSSAAQLLHLAAHGGLSPGGAFVRLADGEVTATDIVTWKVAPRVVVLASCASGARPSGSMWGALGGAFLAAGSEAVVATLWSVEDAATAALVRGFYAAGGARDPAAALAEAQRRAIAAGVSPRQWAAFVTLGEA